MPTQLPLELWYAVTENLNIVQIKSFLGISKIHRSIAHKLLFSHVKLFFGAPEVSSGEVAGPPAHLTHERTMNRTWEILSAIRLDPYFAQVVNKLTIHTFIQEEFGIFYRGPICEALKALPHLVSFSWVGQFHLLPVQVLDSVIAHCPKLRELSTPSYGFPLSTASLSQLKHIEGLALREFDPRQQFNDFGNEGVHADYDDDAESLLPQLEEVAKGGGIKSLIVATPLLWKLSIRMFENLTELEITFGKDFHNMHLVFRHAERLQSLTFADVFDLKLFQVLAENSSALPLLTSFKAMTGWRSNPDYMQHLLQLSEFLKAKIHLRRLDVQLMCSTIGPFLSVLRELPSIEVLGLFTGMTTLTKEDYLLLAQVLPPKITALRLSTRWVITPDTREAADALIQRFSDLSFFYLRNFELPFAYLMDELASELKHVRVLGLDQRLSYVDRRTEYYATNSGTFYSNAETDPWSWRRIQFRAVEDFGAGGKDFEWLLRYHCLREWEW